MIIITVNASIYTTQAVLGAHVSISAGASAVAPCNVVLTGSTEDPDGGCGAASCDWYLPPSGTSVKTSSSSISASRRAGNVTRAGAKLVLLGQGTFQLRWRTQKLNEGLKVAKCHIA